MLPRAVSRGSPPRLRGVPHAPVSTRRPPHGRWHRAAGRTRRRWAAHTARPGRADSAALPRSLFLSRGLVAAFDSNTIQLDALTDCCRHIRLAWPAMPATYLASLYHTVCHSIAISIAG